MGLGRAWGTQTAAVGAAYGLEDDNQPYVERVEASGGTRLRMVFPDYDLWGKPNNPDFLKMFFNLESLAILAGWPTRLRTQVGEQKPKARTSSCLFRAKAARYSRRRWA